MLRNARLNKRIFTMFLVLALLGQSGSASGQSADDTAPSSPHGNPTWTIVISVLGALGGYLLHHRPQTVSQPPLQAPPPPPPPPSPPAPSPAPPPPAIPNPPVQQTTENVCPPQTKGYFEPTQGVWQDDDFFDDRPTKQLTSLSPASYDAELAMVEGRDTLLFGIRQAEGASGKLGYRPKDRNNIVVAGTTFRTQPVRMSMRITLVEGSRQRILYQSVPAYTVYWDGPCSTTPHRFGAALDASHGIPPPPNIPFRFQTAGPYNITAELYNGAVPSGLKVIVFGKSVVTQGPTLNFVPIIGSRNPTAQARELAETTAHYGPIYFPLAPDGLPTVLRKARRYDDLKKSALERETDRTNSPFPESIDWLPASLADEFNGIADASKIKGRMIIVLDPSDSAEWGLPIQAHAGFAILGVAVSTKVILLNAFTNFLIALHEVAHTEPKYRWSSDEMEAECGYDYHGPADALPIYTIPAPLVKKPVGRQMPRLYRGLFPGTNTVAGVAYGVRTALISNVGYREETWSPANGFFYFPAVTPSTPVSMAAVMGDTQPPLLRQRFARASEIMGGPVVGGVVRSEWITQCTYWHLVDAFQQKQDPHLLLVRGLLGGSGGHYAAELHPIYERDGDAELAPGATHGWAIVLRGRDGRALATYPFVPSWKYTDDTRSRTVIAFTYAVPEVANTARIEIARAGKVLAHVDRTSGAPSLAVTAPPDGNTASGETLHLAWRAKSADGRALLSSVLISSDRGQNWLDELFESDRTAFDLAAPRRGQELWAKVVVNDGSRTTERTVKYRGP
jgi:hypothetical protein